MERGDRIKKLEKTRDDVMEEISASLTDHNARQTLDWLAVLHEISNRIRGEENEKE